jgi:hypothetical protein
MMAALTPKEGLWKKEQQEYRASSHLIKEKEAKNYNSLCGGGGSKIATQAMPPSLQLAELPPKSADLPSLTTWLGCG